jgi:CRP-like cAMP-binding protein
MELFKFIVGQIVDLESHESKAFNDQLSIHEFKKGSLLSLSGKVPEEVFFIEKGLVRVVINDSKGAEHTIHFSQEGQFIADYASYLRKQPAHYALQALEDTRVVLIPRLAIEWGYANLKHGDKLGRLLAELYFTFHDDRIKSLYSLTPLQRYNGMERIFPEILSRVPQHMIASYLGISSVHLSRLKNQK